MRVITLSLFALQTTRHCNKPLRLVDLHNMVILIRINQQGSCTWIVVSIPIFGSKFMMRLRRSNAGHRHTCLIQAFHYLLTVLLSDGGQFVVTNVRVLRQSFQAGQNGRQFSSASLRLHQSMHGQISRSALTQLKDSVNILLPALTGFAAGVTVNRVKLAVKGSNSSCADQVVPVASSSIRTGVVAGRRLAATASEPGLQPLNQFHQQRTTGNALFFNSEIVLLPVSPERIQSRPLRIDGCSQVINVHLYASASFTIKGDGDAIFRQARKSGTSI